MDNIHPERYKDTKNSFNRAVYRICHYVYGDMPEEGIVVYILLVLKDTEADLLEEEIRRRDETCQIAFFIYVIQYSPIHCNDRQLQIQISKV